MKVPEVLKQVQRHPSYDMQGKCEKKFFTLFLTLVHARIQLVYLCVYVCVCVGGGDHVSVCL